MKLSDLNANYLIQKLEELNGLTDSNKRGREFENLLEHLFRASGLWCKRDVRSDAREQIDLIVRWEQYLALVEAKWQKNPVSITQLQAFQWRLRQRGNVTIGIFIAINGFSDFALQEAKIQETSLLLLDETDLSAILSQNTSLTEILWMKLWEI